MNLELDFILWEKLIPKVDFITKVRDDELCVDMGLVIVKSGIALSDASKLVPGKSLSKGWDALAKILNNELSLLIPGIAVRVIHWNCCSSTTMELLIY